ncbi:MAG TPA: pentapeptide repeat-containing protein [Acidimicrobiales bacterium]|nr:pentapeptide repeat-containing protein [Acidimicrobiales bacterium]
MKATATRADKRRAEPRRRFGVVAAALMLLGVFGLSACQPSPADTALKLTLSDTASSNAPAAHVTVSAFPASDAGAPATANGITDMNGTVWFPHDQLPAGDYVVMFGSPTFVDPMWGEIPGSDNARWYNGSATDAATERSGAEVVTVSDASMNDLSESYAMPRGHVGAYLYQRATPLAGFTATLYAVPSAKVVATVTTGADGHVEFTDVPAQDYQLGFAKDGWTTIWAGSGNGSEYSLADATPLPAVRSGIERPDFDHYPKAESTISGAVTDGVSPVGGVWVVASVAATGHAALVARTAADGTFTLHGLSATDYKVTFYDPTGAHSALVYGQQNKVDLAQGTTVSLGVGADESVGEVALPGSDCAAAESGEGSLIGADLRNCPLDGVNFVGKHLLNADLNGASLQNANLHGVGLFGMTFVGTDFSGADVSYANLGQSTFMNVDFTGADFTTTDIQNANLARATLTGVVSSGVRGTPAALPTGWTLVGGVLTPPA